MFIAGHRQMRPDLVDQTVMFLAVFLSMSAKMCCKTDRKSGRVGKECVP